MSTYYFVLGMHRSGTSMVAEVLLKLGIGAENPHQLQGPDEHNVRGYFEDRKMQMCNKLMFIENGGEWDNPPKKIEKVSKGLMNQMKKCVKTASPTGGSVMWKDPRLCFTLEKWLPLVPASEIIFVGRDSRAISESLIKRNQMSSDEAYYLFMKYIAATKGVKVGIFINYDTVIERPKESVVELA